MYTQPNGLIYFIYHVIIPLNSRSEGRELLAIGQTVSWSVLNPSKPFLKYF